MTYRGHMKGGVVVLDEPVDLPEGTAVEVKQAAPSSSEVVSDDIRRTREFLLSIAGTVDDPSLPNDLARNHDHYLHGAPKK